jgi:hypothetical protein
MDNWIVITLAISALIFRAAEALDCTVCTWTNADGGEDDCQDGKDTTKAALQSTCPGNFLGSDYEERCVIKDVKYKILGITSQTIERLCGVVPKDTSKECSTDTKSDQWTLATGGTSDLLNAFGDVSGNICYCDTDNCNGSSHVTISMAAIIISCMLGWLCRQ